MQELTAGSRWRSAVSDAEVIVVKAPSETVTLSCGGAEMLPAGTPQPSGATLDPAFDQGLQIGKRYVSPTIEIEVLCNKAGAGSLSINGEILIIKESKALPSSD